MYNQLKVPIGLINTSWGGTQSEAWISKQAFEQSPEMKYTANAMGSNNTDQFIKQRGETTLNNIKKLQGSFENNANTDDWKNAGFDDSKWPAMQLPGLWEA